MNSGRRFVVVLFLLTLAASAAVCVYDVFQPGVSPAEKAYRMGWRTVIGHTIYSTNLNEGQTRSWLPYTDNPPCGNYGYAPDFRKAVNLDSKDIRYQLSLVQSLSDDSSALSRLLNDGRILPQARAMAAYLSVRPSSSNIWARFDGESALPPPANPNLKIHRLEMAKQFDPENAATCYAEALVYYVELNRERDGAMAVREGNSRPTLREYHYVDPQFRRTLAGESCELGVFGEEAAGRRELARRQVVYANRLNRQKKTAEAIRVLEDTTEFGRRQASAEPRTGYNYIVGMALMRIASSSLDPMYKDFGMLKEHERLARVNEAFMRGAYRIKTPPESRVDVWSQIYHGNRPAVIMLDLWSFAVSGCVLSAALLALVCLCWLPARILRERLGQEEFAAPEWRPWKLERLLLPLIAVFAGLSAIAVIAIGNTEIESGETLVSSLNQMEAAPGFATGIAVVLLLIVCLAFLRRDYAAREGKTGWLRFLFLLPIAQFEWKSKRLVGGLAAVLLIFVWVGLLVMLTQRLSLGAYPWRPDLMCLGHTGSRSAKLVTEILKTIPR